MYKKPIILGEIGGNHKGSIVIAKEMIDVLIAYCKVDVIKFQKRDNKLLFTDKEYNTPHPVEYNSYGKTYGEHRDFLEFSVEQHKELKEYIESKNCIYSTSVWDENSAKQIIDLSPKLIKIPSASNLNYKIYDIIADNNYKGELHISLGMTYEKEFLDIVFYLRNKDLLKNTIFYHCTSGYPIESWEMLLLEIKNLVNYQKIFNFKDIGYSGHHKGISGDMVAYTLGANYIERHFTLDRTWKGTDHSASLEPDGMRKLVRDLCNGWNALQYKKKELLDCEKIQRKKLKKI